MTQQFIANALNPWKFSFYQFLRLPAAWFMGLRVQHLDADTCTVRLPFRWQTKNPFRSVYFAAQMAAGEMSTGLLALGHLQGKPATSMLVRQVEAEFLKKASAPLFFTCEEGASVRQVLAHALADGQGHLLRMTSTGRLPDGTIACRIYVTWTFRRK